MKIAFQFQRLLAPIYGNHAIGLGTHRRPTFPCVNARPLVCHSHWSWILPGIFFMGYVFLSHPMMYPGFDIWIHLVRIEFGAHRAEPWHAFWSAIFHLLNLEDHFSRALLIHRAQISLAGLMLFLSARWVLRLIFISESTPDSLINLSAWMAVLIWALMHGTVSTAINGPAPVWQSWLQWYSVNYQIALPMYFFSVAALMKAVLSPEVVGRLWIRLTYFSVAAFAAVGIVIIHAAELPYLLFAIGTFGVIFFRRSWWRIYLAGLVLMFLVIQIGLETSYQTPTGIAVFLDGGGSALMSEVSRQGEWVVARGNRGNASWNYWYWVNLVLSMAALVILWPRVSSPQRKVVLFVILSAVPAGSLFFTYSAGSISMLTYPRLAWRFTFSSFLFLAPSIFVLSVTLLVEKLRKPVFLVVFCATLVFSVLFMSRAIEHNSVSYEYAKSLLISMSREQMRYGFLPHESEWLNEVYSRLEAAPLGRVLCTDMFTAYYLYFVKGYSGVALPERIGRGTVPRIRGSGCAFPRDGGDVLQLGLDSVPWRF